MVVELSVSLSESRREKCVRHIYFFKVQFTRKLIQKEASTVIIPKWVNFAKIFRYTQYFVVKQSNSRVLKAFSQNKAEHLFFLPGYFSIGCWRDQPERALPSLEGIFPMLDGNDYKARKLPIKKCATIARVQGFPAFALENGGQCLGGKDILQTYNMYGASSACEADGRGGPWSMEVYKFTSKLFIMCGQNSANPVF